MGDVHFLIRHGLTGFVFLIFVLFGVTILDLVSRSLTGNAFVNLSGLLSGNINVTAILPVVVTTLTTAFITTPVIGVVVQGASTAWQYWNHYGNAFGDPARSTLAEYVRQAVRAGATGHLYKDLYEELKDIRDDALFVWLYHTRAQPHLVEWARRRRSYHYLGVNWTLAALSGAAVGILVPVTYKYSLPLLVICLIVLSGLWIAGMLYLSQEMKRDVDDMEFVWTLSQLYPEVFEPIISGKRVPAFAKSSENAGRGSSLGRTSSHRAEKSRLERLIALLRAVR